MNGLTQKQKLDQFPRLMKERDLLDLTLCDVLNGRFIWGKWCKESDGPGKYRAGINTRESCPIALQVFRYPNQLDSFQAMYLETWEEQLRRLRNGSECWEPNVLALQSAKDALRRPLGVKHA
jgi:hypothetical protein